jgi:hypothetical protein
MFRRDKAQNVTLGLLVWITLVANGAAAAYLAKDADFYRPKQLNARVGNDFAGSDIYGIGVRVGFYLQGIAFAMNAFTSETRKGMLLAAASVQAAILASLSVLLSRDSISPAEMLIILDMIAFTTLPAILALITVDSRGQGLGVVLFVVDTLWANGLTTWFWAKGYNTLPLLGTSNAGFIYTRVQIDGWFRTFNLVYASLAWVGEVGILILGAYLLQQSFGYFEDEENEFKESSVIDFILPVIPWSALIMLIFTIPLLVVATEKMIQWNNLSPTTDLSAPGQVIPFAVGVVGLCDASLGIIRHLVTKGDRALGGRNTVHARRRHSRYVR